MPSGCKSGKEKIGLSRIGTLLDMYNFTVTEPESHLELGSVASSILAHGLVNSMSLVKEMRC